MRALFAICLAALALPSCARRNTALDDLETRAITLPSGQQIRAEVRINPREMQLGMMFRDSLPRGRGMLFIHKTAGPYTYWMHNVRIPLDIVFMDKDRKVLGIAQNAPPCNSPPEQCPAYGGNPNTQIVLELGGGEARRLGIQPGQTLAF